VVGSGTLRLGAYMTESAAPRSHRREHIHKKADDLLDDLFEDLDSGLRTSPMLPRQWGSRFQSPLYPEGYGGLSPAKRGWGKWLIVGGVIGVALASWGLWRSYSDFVAQVIEPESMPKMAEFPPQLEGIPAATPALTAPTTAEEEPSIPETETMTPARTAAAPQQSAPPAPRPPVRPAPSRAAGSVAFSPPEPDVIRHIAPSPQRIQSSINQPLPLKLVGTVSGPGTPIALILVDDVVREVPVGQTVLGNWRVQSVSRDGIILSNGRQGMPMYLGLGQRQ